MRAIDRAALVVALFVSLGSCARSGSTLVAPYPDDVCSPCDEWNLPQPPLRIYGNSYFVGTRGLSAILITSETGHALIDGGLPDSAPQILDNIARLGFDLADVKLILNSHAHFDHAGGIAAIRKATGARVAASVPSGPVLEEGRSGPDDPQFGSLLDYPGVASVERLDDGQIVSAGSTSLAFHPTPGHTPGGTTWSWESCEADRCLSMVYADSLTPVSADGFLFSGNTAYPAVIEDFERSFAFLDRIPCDILLTPHPGASSFWSRLEGGAEPLVDASACREYSDAARRMLARRLESERAGH